MAAGRGASDRKCRETDQSDRHCASRNLERPIPLTQRKRCGGVQRLIIEPICKLVSWTAGHCRIPPEAGRTAGRIARYGPGWRRAFASCHRRRSESDRPV